MEWADMDLESIMAKARISEDGETYLNLRSGENGRLGVCACCSDEATMLVLELLVCVLKDGHPIDLQKCYRGLDIALEARNLGFELTSQGDGWIYCQKSVLPGEIGHLSTMVGRMIE
ncbi:MAG TPA: hypothetical protein VGK23_12385 [Methanomassiliicoccales archaeon]|jgi:hypothetical protein